VPKFQVTSPDGRKFVVDAPDGATQDDAIKYVQTNILRQDDSAPPAMETQAPAPVEAPKEDERAFLAKLNDPTTTAGAVLKAPDMFLRGASVGASDYARAGMEYLADKVTGKDASFEKSLQGVRATNEAQRDAAPIASYGAEIAGGITSPVFRGVASAVNKATTKAGQLAGVAVPRYLQYGIQGAAAGGVAGLGNAQNEQGGVPTLEQATKGAATDAAIGGALGVALPAVVEGGAALLKKTAAMMGTKASSMSAEQFRTAAKDAYKASEDAGVVISQPSFKGFVTDLPTQLKGFDEDVTPGAANIIKALTKKANQGPVTLEMLDNLRSIAGEASIGAQANEARLAGNIADKIDDFIDGLKPADLIGGDAKAGADALYAARDFWKTHSKLKRISQIVETGENLNDENWVKNQFRAIVRKPAQFNRFTKDEQEAIKEVARTGLMEHIIKLIPHRGLQMASTYAEPAMQGAKIKALQDLVAGGGKSQSLALSPEAAKFFSGLKPSAPALRTLSRTPAASLSSIFGGSNQ